MLLAFIKGKIIHLAENFLIVETNNLGYKVFILPGKFKTSQEIELYLYHQIRENDQSLYGFRSSKQQQTFELLLEVSGIGPKKSMEILGKVDYKILLSAIKNQDKKSLELNGLTSTMADKILSGLKNKIKKIVIDSSSGGRNKINEEVVDALKRLGYKDQEIFRVLKEVDGGLGFKEKIKEALRKLGN